MQENDDVQDLGVVLPGWNLILALQDGELLQKGQFGLCRSDGHVVFAFTTRPTPDPAPKKDDEVEGWLDSEENTRLFMDWSVSVESFYKELKAGLSGTGAEFADIHALIKSAVEAGWSHDSQGDFQYWLFERLAALFLEDQPLADDAEAWLGQPPRIGEVWEHTASGKRYRIDRLVYNTITDEYDVEYIPLYKSDIPYFTRQMKGHPKSFFSVNDDGTPRMRCVS